MSTTYSHVFTTHPTVPVARVTRPLCVFRVLYHGCPIFDELDGLPIEHGSQEAAELRGDQWAAERHTARENVAVERRWL